MNLALMRQDNMVRKFLEVLRVDYLAFPDQDVLNQLCKGRILRLALYYNSIRTSYLPQYKKEFLRKYMDRDWEDIHKYATVYYTGAKPWNSFTVGFQLWWQYNEQLSAAIKEEWEINNWSQNIYHILKYRIK